MLDRGIYGSGLGALQRPIGATRETEWSLQLVHLPCYKVELSLCAFSFPFSKILAIQVLISLLEWSFVKFSPRNAVNFNDLIFNPILFGSIHTGQITQVSFTWTPQEGAKSECNARVNMYKTQVNVQYANLKKKIRLWFHNYVEWGKEMQSYRLSYSPHPCTHHIDEEI